MFRTLFLGLLAAGVLSSCDYVTAGLTAYDAVEWWNEPGLDIPIDRETGKPLLDEARVTWRATGLDSYGPSTSGLHDSTEVWAVTGRWYHVTDEAGMAWPANSGLTWDEKFAAWVDQMEPVPAESGWHTTLEVETPWGKTLPAPRLECAELAMFLRAAFASWHGLPFYMSAWHPDTGNLHFGHFGIVDDDGHRISGYPTYRDSYIDYTATFAGKPASEVLDSWPTDAALRERKLTQLADDANSFLGPDAYSGAYFDEMFLNKRVGHLLLSLLTNMGSMHVASDVNSWNLQPEAVRHGDPLVQRWQAQGIGHVVVLKEVDWTPGGVLEPEVMYGSMPRIQPKWYDENISRTYLTSDKAGGPGTDSDGTPYSRFGGGLKRWRTPVEKGGRWVNIVPTRDRDFYIPSTDWEALEGRIETFERLMGTLSPEEEQAAILERIELAREALREKPASCSNRIRREEAFDDLYALNTDAFGIDRAATDAEHRLLEDYVLAELEYDEAKTCCWNSTTPAMFDIIMDYAFAEQPEDACVEPTVFRAEGGGYARWRTYAADTDRFEQWVDWNDDETCPQQTVIDDVIVPSDAAAWCEVNPVESGTGESDLPEEGCGDITWDGICDGDTVVWCDDDELQFHSCTGGQTCGWVDNLDYYWCESQ